MRKILFLLLLSIPALAISQKLYHYTIQGQIANAEGKNVYLTQRGHGFRSDSKVIMLDSCKVVNGQFLFKGSIKEPNYYSILVKDSKGWFAFILSENKLTFSGDANTMWSSVISGSTDIIEADSLRRALSKYINQSNDLVDSISYAQNKSDSINTKRFTDQYMEIASRQREIKTKFIRSHPSNFESLKQLESIYDAIQQNESKDLYNSLSKDLKDHSIAKNIKYQLYDIENVIQSSVSFSLTDTSDHVVNIDTIKSEYLLIDFWASWCGPCRKETPTIKIAYDKYREKGFEIIAISLDSDKKSWIDAIKKDSMTWINVSDLKGWENEVAKKYGIKAIPANFLVDKNKRIIATNLRGEDLLNKLKELYK